MGFPVNIYGSYGDEKVTSTSKIGSLPLGTRMILPDGRIFAHAHAGESLVVGKLAMSEDTVDAHDTDLIVYTATAIGATTVNITVTTTVVTKNQYEEGYLTVCDDTGEGYVYKIKEHAAALSSGSGSLTVTLEDGDAIKVAMTAGTTTVGLRRNEFKDLELWDAAAIVGIPAGVNPVAVTDTHYFWIQRRGPCAVYTDATSVTLGCGVVASTTVDGAIGLIQAAATSGANNYWDENEIGFLMNDSASTEYSLVYLTLD